MNLQIQIQTILFSFLYGIFFACFLHLSYKIIYSEKKFIKIFMTFLFVVVNVLCYFIFLRKINDGIVHPYGLFMIVFGFYIGNGILNIVFHFLKRFIKKNKKSH